MLIFTVFIYWEKTGKEVTMVCYVYVWFFMKAASQGFFPCVANRC